MLSRLRVPSGILIAAFLFSLSTPAFSAADAAMPTAATNHASSASPQGPVQLQLYSAPPFACDAAHYGALTARQDGMLCVCMRFGDWKPDWLRLNPMEPCWPEK